MLQLPPVLISVIGHVFFLFYAILVSIFSAWTTHRVHLASSACPMVDDIPSFSPKSRPLIHRASFSLHDHDHLSLFSRRSQSLASEPLRRSLSISSLDAKFTSSSPLLSPISLPSPKISPSSPDSYPFGDAEFPCKEQDLASAEMDFRNSPTGTMVDILEDGSSWVTRSDLTEQTKRTARQVLCTLAAARMLAVLPAVVSHIHSAVTNWQNIFLSGFDLTLVDLVTTTILLFLPVGMMLAKFDRSLPPSFEHYVYYCNTILLVIPLVATLQCPNTAAITLYKMIAPVISTIMLLIARDQAMADFWKPMNEKARWTVVAKR